MIDVTRQKNDMLNVIPQEHKPILDRFSAANCWINFIEVGNTRCIENQEWPILLVPATDIQSTALNKIQNLLVHLYST